MRALAAVMIASAMLTASLARAIPQGDEPLPEIVAFADSTTAFRNAAVAEQLANGSYEELAELFRQLRVLERPLRIDGVPNYSAAAMDSSTPSCAVTTSNWRQSIRTAGR